VYANEADTVSVFYFSFISPCATGFISLNNIHSYTVASYYIISVIFRLHTRTQQTLATTRRQQKTTIHQLQQLLDLLDSVNSTPRERCDVGVTSFLGNRFAAHTYQTTFTSLNW